MGSPRDALLALAASLGATLGLVGTHGVPFEWNRGPSARWWEPVRRRLSRLAGTLDPRAGPRPITDGEYAGSLRLSLDEAESLLWRDGFVRNPFSRLKLRDGRPEAGSWVYRASPLSRRQLHLMLFVDDGSVDVYAHEEPSSVNPVVATRHFDGAGQDVAAGVARARDRLPLDTAGATVEPVTGPWDAQPGVRECRG